MKAQVFLHFCHPPLVSFSTLSLLPQGLRLVGYQKNILVTRALIQSESERMENRPIACKVLGDLLHILSARIKSYAHPYLEGKLEKFRRRTGGFGFLVGQHSAT